jgi:ABC transport system ATP-binding/permease protein
MTDAHPPSVKAIRIVRQLDNDSTLADDLDAARDHAKSRNPERGFEVIDLGSRRGTYVNGERVTRKMLAEGDIVSIGDATFRLSGGELRPYAGESRGSGETGGTAK